MKYAGECGSSGFFCYGKKKNLLYRSTSYGSGGYDDFYKIKNGKLVTVKSFYNFTTFLPQKTTYKINNKKVSKKTYQTQLKAWKKKMTYSVSYGAVHKDQRYRITNENIQVFKQKPSWFVADDPA